MARICDQIPSRSDLETLRGLYLGEVAAADAKLGAVRDALVESGFAERLVTVVTSDHGQHFGEHRLQGHQWSVRTPLLHVPLVVHGLPAAAPARITEQVDLVDILPSVLGWLDLGVPDELSGRPLPTREPETPGSRDLVSVYSDFPALDWPESMGTPEIVPLRRLGGCEGQEPLYGRMVAWTRHPHRLLWFADHPAELYDLRWDPAERSNLVDVQPEIAAELTREVERFIAAGNLPDPSGVDPSMLAPELVRALRELGYLE